jgi:cellulose synthase/poly-beta-1,6-N-acetylglucosamine synthase-like glycosyltransferase
LAVVMAAVAAAIVAFDFQNLLAWWRGRVIEPAADERWDFTIVVPVFGDPRYFAERTNLLRYRPHVLVALEVSSPVMADFAALLENEGWRVCRIRSADPNPASLVAAALESVTTAYVLRLDADTVAGDDLANAVAAFADDGADVGSVKVEALRASTVCARLQALEYRIAMLSRHFRPWLTSGACFIARTSSLREIYAQHSLWSPGEDIETGRVAHALRMRIRHVELTVATEVPQGWRALLRQRRLWWAGSFRHWWVNLDRNLLQLPIVTAYALLVVWASLYYKWWNLVDVRSLPSYLPLVFAVYVLVTVVSNLQVWSPWMLVFPLYALAQVSVLPAAGAAQYVLLARRRRRLGRYRFGYRRHFPESLRRERRPPTRELAAWAAVLQA